MKSLLAILITLSCSIASGNPCTDNAQLIDAGKVAPCSGVLSSVPLMDHLNKERKKVPKLEELLKVQEDIIGKKDELIQSYDREVKLHEDDKKQLKKDAFRDKIIYFFVGAAVAFGVDRLSGR